MQVTYIALSPSDLSAALRDAARQDELIKADKVEERFGLSEESLKKLVDKGAIRAYANVHVWGVWYKPEEISKTFKPIIQ